MYYQPDCVIMQLPLINIAQASSTAAALPSGSILPTFGHFFHFWIFPQAKHLGKWQKMEKCLRIDRVHLEGPLATAV